VQQKSAFFLDMDPLAQPSASIPNGEAAGQPDATPSEAAPAAPVKRYSSFAKQCCRYLAMEMGRVGCL